MLFSEIVSVNLSSIAEDEVSGADKAPSLFLRREDPLPRSIIIPATFTVNLKETDTFFLLDIKNCVEDNCIIEETKREIKNTLSADKTNEIYINDSRTNTDEVVRQMKTFSHTAIQTSDLSSVMKKKNC